MSKESNAEQFLEDIEELTCGKYYDQETKDCAKSKLEALIASEKVSLLERLKDEADRTFGNVKQLIYTELDEAERAALTGEE